LALKLQVGEDADRNFRCGVNDAAIDHMTADDLALGIGDAHVEVNAAGADRPGDRQNFMFAVDSPEERLRQRGVGILARKSQGHGFEAADAAEDDSGGDVFCVRDRFEGLAQVYVGGQAESQGFEGAAGSHILYFCFKFAELNAFSWIGLRRVPPGSSPQGPSLGNWMIASIPFIIHIKSIAGRSSH
jgi:hypothetical protein